MPRNQTGRKERAGGLMIGLLGMSLLGLAGCANKQPSAPAPTVSTEQVRGHADKAFENLKQEERDRAPDPAGASY